MVNSDLYTHAEDASGNLVRVAPTTTSDPDWKNRWITPSGARHWVLKDPLLDWFEAVHDALNMPSCPLSTSVQADLNQWLMKDTAPDVYLQFLWDKGNAFEAAVIRDIRNAGHNVRVIAASGRRAGMDSRTEAKVEETTKAMDDGVPVIAQAVLWEPSERFYGIADLLVRSDRLVNILRSLNGPGWSEQPFQGDLEEEAPELEMQGGLNYHYRVIDVKFSTVNLLANGDMSSNHDVHATQLAIYNACLERIQGVQIPEAYILGRKVNWSSRSTDSAFAMLGVADMSAPVNPYLVRARQARDWRTRVRTQSWDANGDLTLSPLPTPTVASLYPNQNNEKVHPWKAARNHVAEQLKELTMVKGLRLDARNDLHAGTPPITGWDDTTLPAKIRVPEVKGIGAKTAEYIAKQVEINQQTAQKTNPVQGTTIPNHPSACVEFYVDFETVNNQGDEFLSPPDGVFPRIGGQDLIYMIGCGHEDAAGGWQFSEFVTQSLTIAEEERIITEWHAHMDSIASAMAEENECDADDRDLYHWTKGGGAEPAQYPGKASARRKVMDSAKSDYAAVNWVDLEEFIKTAEFVVKGCWGTSLKPFINAMHDHFGAYDSATGEGLDKWPSGSTVDGKGAMVAAWDAELWSRDPANPSDMTQYPLMQDAIDYNEADCKVMWQLLKHIRKHHT